MSERGGGGDAIWWAGLQRVPGLGAASMLRLARAFGSPRRAAEATVEALSARGGLSTDQAEMLAQVGRDAAELRLRVREWREQGIELVSLTDDRYPRSLLDLRAPPPLLYVKGSFEARDQRAIAIVGTRAPTGAAAAVAQRLATGFADRGYTIVSGLARGIDTAGHRGALAAPEGRTVGIVGCGLRRVYPPENESLYQAVSERGCVLSEVPPDTAVQRRLLLARDRIQAGLSRAVIVVQAHARCGSIVTARHAVRCGRLLYTLPWPESPFAEGGARLQSMGARLLEAEADLDAICAEIEDAAPPRWLGRLL